MKINLQKHSYLYDTVTSTNDVLYQMAYDGAENGTVIVARHQTAGKGSHGRSWISEDADNIYCSLLLKTQLSAVESAILPIATALGIQRVLGREMSNRVWIKWPNDVIACDRKICGILAEYHGLQTEKFLIIGFGINVNQQVFSTELCGKAASISLLEGHEFDTGQLLSFLLQELEGIYENCISDRSLAEYRDEIHNCLLRRGDIVQVSTGKIQKSVLLNGINNDGSLCVTTSEGQIQNVYSGKVSLRGKGRYI